MSSLCSPRMVNFFKAGCDKHRQFILTLLEKEKSLNASQILSHLKITQPTLSHHLKILKEAKLVVAKKKGKKTFYSLDQNFIIGCCQDLIDDVS